MRNRFDLSSLPLRPDFHFEQELWSNGVQLVGGVDEAGRGALAGPVAAAILVLPQNPDLCQVLWGVRDSKVMSPVARAEWAQRIKNTALGFAVGFASNLEIDEVGILRATHLAVERALAQLSPSPAHLLTDFLKLSQVNIPQTSLVKGDARSLSIAGASILAKTTRDAWMCSMDEAYPGYGFRQHKGYGTLQHRRCLSQLGPSSIHRLSFRYRTTDLEASEAPG